MISRRTFLVCMSLTPLLVFLNRPNASSALSLENLNMWPSQLGGEVSSELAIEGWYEHDLDITKTQIISLSSNWQSSWL